MNLDRFCFWLCWLAVVPACAQSYNADLTCNTGAVANGNYFGAGTSFADFNGDGWPDITCATYTDLFIYQNNEGVCEFVSLELDLDFDVKLPVWVDFDNDGDRDLFVTQYQGPEKLFENDGDFNFTDISEEAGFGNYPGPTFGQSWGDYDKDGDLDLYICRYIFSITDEQEEFQTEYENRLYRNNGNGTFEDVTATAGVSDGVSLSFQSAWIDYNKDSWPDLYVINDMEHPNRLYHNNGDGTFSEVGEAAGADVPLADAMSVSAGDFNNDGYEDLFMTNVAIMDAVLLENNGDGTFTDIAVEAGVDLDQYGWGANWVDIDNDGFLDLYICEYYYDAPELPNIIMMNNGDGTFSNTSADMLQFDVSNSYSVSSADWNRDGGIDFLVSNLGPQVADLWQADPFPSRWIQMNPVGTVSNRDGIGVEMEVWTGDLYQYRYSKMGENYLGQDSDWELFGLGSTAQVDSIRLTWPSGIVDMWYDLPLFQFLTLEEGTGFAYDFTASAEVLCPGSSVTLTIETENDFTWVESGSTGALEVDMPGWYLAEFEVPGGTYVDSIQVIESVPTMPEFALDLPVCIGDTGTATLLNPEAFTNVDWNGADPAQLTAGAYAAFLTDLNGCINEYFLTVDAPDPLVLTANVQDPLCAGEATGSVTLELTGGTPPYTYNQGAAMLDSLMAGTYEILVTDSNGCVLEDVIEVGAPPLLVLNLDYTCTSFSIVLNATGEGGTPPLSYTWEDGTTGQVYVGDLGESYEVTLEDANGCMQTAEASCPVNIEELELAWTLVPNPAREHFKVLGLGGCETLEVFTTTGALQAQAQLCPGMQVDVSDWPAGVYQVKVGMRAFALTVVR